MVVSVETSTPPLEQTPATTGKAGKAKWSVRQDHSLFYIVLICSIVLIAGWLGRENSNLSAQDGLGYALGIIGGSMMLILLLYPLRKHVRFMRVMGSVKFWFRFHMMLGVVGPVLVIFHSNFGLGSTNSNIALFCMITVALSGLIGRFIYSKIHIGLYGEKASLEELRDNLKLTRGKLGNDISLSTDNTKRIARFEKSLLKKRLFLLGVFHLPVNAIYAKWIAWRVYRSVKHSINKQARTNNWDKSMTREILRKAHYSLSLYTLRLRKFAELQIYNQLFSIWHYAHLPMFFLLIITGIIHVVVVHAY